VGIGEFLPDTIISHIHAQAANATDQEYAAAREAAMTDKRVVYLLRLSKGQLSLIFPVGSRISPVF
jgi:septin family protein